MSERWISFDLDGTLMQNPFIDWVFPEIEEIVSKAANKKVDVKKAMFTEHVSLMQQNKGLEAYDWDAILKKFLTQHEIQCEINIEEIVKKHCVPPKISLLEENIIEILQQLKNRGYRLAIITNGYAKYQKPVVEALQLSGLFDFFITPEMVNCAKPNRKIIAPLLGEGGLVAHVGDRVDHDMFLAAQANSQAVFIYRNMPNELRAIAPSSRSREGQFLHLYKEKWKRETGLIISESNILPTPDFVIYSIQELVDIFR